MTEPTAPSPCETQVNDALRISRCPECGYLLTGLPPCGRCPECGWDYRPDQIVLFGWGCGTKCTPANARPRHSRYRLLIVVLWLIFIAGQFIMSRNQDRSFVCLQVCLMVPIAIASIIQMYRRRQLTAEGRLPAQLRLTPVGFGQRNGFGPIKLHRWTTKQPINLEQVRPGCYRLRIRNRPFTFWKSIYDMAYLEFDIDAEIAQQIFNQVRTWRSVQSPSLA